MKVGLLVVRMPRCCNQSFNHNCTTTWSNHLLNSNEKPKQYWSGLLSAIIHPTTNASFVNCLATYTPQSFIQPKMHYAINIYVAYTKQSFIQPQMLYSVNILAAYTAPSLFNQKCISLII